MEEVRLAHALRAVATLAVLGAALGANAPSATAASVSEGEALLTLDLGVWTEFGLTPETWIGPAGDALPVGPDTGEDLLDTPGEGFANPQAHPVNPVGVDVTPDPRRTAPPTDFTYTATDVATLRATATGAIALAGVSRWVVSPDLGGGRLLFGDYALSWNASDQRWELANYIDFPVAVFWIGDPVETVGPGDDFSVSGDLIGSPFLNILLDGAFGRDFGEFEFATLVPEPAHALSCLVAAAALAALRHRSGGSPRQFAARR